MAQKKISDLTLGSAFSDTVNLAGDDSSQTYRFTGAQIKTYIQEQIADLMKGPRDILNLGLAASVSGNALTISLKQLDGSSAPSSTAPVRVAFRGTTASNGDSTLVSATAATSLVISSGSTLGFTSAIEGKIYVYALNNGGTIELAASGSPWDESSLQTTTAEGGAGAADSGTVLYSTAARTSKAIRLIGILKATEATAGTWATAPSEVQVTGGRSPAKAPTQQRFTSGSGTYTTPSPAPLYLKVRMVGGGGGGGGSGTSNGTAATNGGDTTFGSSLLTAGGGVKGARGINGPAGGTATIASPAYGTALSGGNGGGDGGTVGSSPTSAVSPVLSGGMGGSSVFGGGGASGSSNASVAGGAAVANTGGGGGGAGVGPAANAQTGTGGGAGAFVDAIVTNPSTTYAYAVGAAGSGQAAGASGYAGGAGAAGYIEVTEHYQ